MLDKFFAIILRVLEPKQVKPRLVTPITVESDFPELKHIKMELLNKVNHQIKDLEIFCTIVKCLNEGLEDTRLESKSGTLQALDQLREYSILTRRFHNIIVNERVSKREKTPFIFFEV